MSLTGLHYCRIDNFNSPETTDMQYLIGNHLMARRDDFWLTNVIANVKDAVI